MSSTKTNKENLAPIPLLAYAKPAARLELFAKKLKFCCQLYDFSSTKASIKFKETKRIYLNECIEFLKERKDVLVEPVYALSFALFSHNVLRVIPSKTQLYDPDRNDHVQDPSWVHMQLVYIYFIRLLDSPNFHSSKAKQFIDHSFVSRLIDLFASDDEDERDHLRVTLHRIYAKFISLRAFMRKEITNKCLELVFEDLYLPGITELLEVLGSIINGYSSPVKPEHVCFLHQVLIPLHYLPKIKHFHPQLVYCISQYFEKDPSVVEGFIKKFIKRWPKTKSPKELRFLDELEELIDIIPPKEFVKIQETVFTQLAKCIRSNNSQISERALIYWENEYLVSLMEENANAIFPIILPSLVEASNYHWDPTISKLATNVVKNFLMDDQKVFDGVVTKLKKSKEQNELKKKQRAVTWRIMESMAKYASQTSVNYAIKV